MHPEARGIHAYDRLRLGGSMRSTRPRGPTFTCAIPQHRSSSMKGLSCEYGHHSWRLGLLQLSGARIDHYGFSRRTHKPIPLLYPDIGFKHHPVHPALAWLSPCNNASVRLVRTRVQHDCHMGYSLEHSPRSRRGSTPSLFIDGQPVTMAWPSDRFPSSFHSEGRDEVNG